MGRPRRRTTRKPPWHHASGAFAMDSWIPHAFLTRSGSTRRAPTQTGHTSPVRSMPHNPAQSQANRGCRVPLRAPLYGALPIILQQLPDDFLQLGCPERCFQDGVSSQPCGPGKLIIQESGPSSSTRTTTHVISSDRGASPRKAATGCSRRPVRLLYDESWHVPKLPQIHTRSQTTTAIGILSVKISVHIP